MDRGKQGLKRSAVTDGTGAPLHSVAAGANRPDSALLEPTLTGLVRLGPLPAMPTIYLNRGYDSGETRTGLNELAFTGVIVRSGFPAPVQAGHRRLIEQPHAWMNGFGPLRRKARVKAALAFFLATALVTPRYLTQFACPLDR